MMEGIGKIEALLTGAGVKPTSNRIIVLRELVGAAGPVSLAELESAIETLDKSSVFRVLTLLLEHHVIHAVEDGRGIVKYELCHGENGCSFDDMHVHFYCEGCHKVYCLEDVPVPRVPLPDGFRVDSVNYMLKGVCKDCQRKNSGR